jgi:hypothetical protein
MTQDELIKYRQESLTTSRFRVRQKATLKYPTAYGTEVTICAIWKESPFPALPHGQYCVRFANGCIGQGYTDNDFVLPKSQKATA